MTARKPASLETMAAAAIDYACRLKIPVFPCKPDKSPHTANGFKDASCDVDQLTEWWERWPNASIGMPTGPASGRIVLDVDPRNGGDESLAKLQERYGPLPPTLRSRTGGGGFHLFFQARGLNIRNSAGILGSGLDVRATGGYVVLPPSPHPSGNRYQWLDERQTVADLPPWLERLLTKPPAKKSTANGAGEKIPEGRRNDYLTSLAGTLRRRGASEDSILAALLAENEHCNPPLLEREVQTIAKSVARYEPSEPQGNAREDVPGRIPVTETSNAERLVRKFGEDLRYCSDRGVWCCWNGKFWAVNDTGGVMRRMQEVARDVYVEAANEPDENLRKALGAWARQSDSRRTQENAAAIARFMEGVEVRWFGDVFDKHPLLLNVKNGTIDLRTGELRPHRREDFLAKIVDIEYDAKATCPKSFKFLNEILPDPGLAGYITRFMGYCLTGMSSEQAWFLFHGPTASGKSTLLNIVRGILGPYALQLPENYFLITKNTSDFATANLAGVRLATCVETNDGRRLDVAKIKHLTGGDPISAALKFQNFFEFVPEHKLVLATNHAPRVPDTDDSIWRRIRVIRFHATVPEDKRIPELAEKLLDEEAPGILQLAVLGCQAWLSDRLSEPAVVKDAVAQYRAAEDVVQSFLDECYVRDPDARSMRKEVYGDFVAWSEESGTRPFSAKKFAGELRRLNVGADSGDRFWLGIRKKDVVA